MKSFRVIVVCGMVLATVAVFTNLWAADPDVIAVRQIINTPQTYDGEHIDKLVELGPEGVPAIGDALARDEQFPLRFVLALEAIGSDAGSDAILGFVWSRAPFSDNDRSFITARSISALGMIGNEVLVEDLTGILEDRESHPRVRLASAASVCRLLAPGNCERAEEVIFDFYDDRIGYISNVNSGFTENELFDAVMAADTNRSMEIILEAIDTGVAPHTTVTIVPHLRGRSTEETTIALLAIASDISRQSLPIRLAAALAIAEDEKYRSVLSEDLANGLLDEAYEDGWSEAVIVDAKTLEELLQK